MVNSTVLSDALSERVAIYRRLAKAARKAKDTTAYIRYDAMADAFAEATREAREARAHMRCVGCGKLAVDHRC